MKTLTIDDILRGAAYALRHPEEYNQATWCGTVCCVLGHARALAGSDQPDRGPRDGEIQASTPRERMVLSMLLWTHEETASLIPHVGEDGKIVVPEGHKGRIGSSARIESGAWIESGAIITKEAALQAAGE